MNETYNPKLTKNARTLRKNMTKEERHLWYDFLKDYPVMVLSIMMKKPAAQTNHEMLICEI